MIVDARSIPTGTVIESDLCVVGAGVAGLAISRDFMDSGVRVALIESGGLSPDSRTQSLYSGDNVGISYDPLDRNRSRYFGGSSNCWGGWCRPFDELDFRRRSWIPYSGWPLSGEELSPYYDRAHAFLGLKRRIYDPQWWEHSLDDDSLRLLPLDGAVENKVVQFSRPPRLGSVYLDQFRSATNVIAYLHANVTELQAAATPTMLRSIAVQTLEGGRFTVAARAFVLAAGGIENPRLLLLSDKVATAGLGNGNDLVGRFFADHPRQRHGGFQLRDPSINRRLYDTTLLSPLRRNNIHDLNVSIQLAPSAEAQESNRLLNSRSFVVGEYRNDGSRGVESLREIFRMVPHRTKFGIEMKALVDRGRVAAPGVLRELPGIGLAMLDNKLNPNRRSRRYHFETVAETIPNRDSRVQLGSERDLLGLRRVQVDLRLSEEDLAALARTKRIVSGALAGGAPKGRDVASAPNEDRDGPIEWCWHHMGTTRMAESPRDGVVDPECRVHGIGNLYVAGSSVFPTFGSGTPTLTIAALALRLADHLKDLFSEPEQAKPTRVGVKVSA